MFDGPGINRHDTIFSCAGKIDSSRWGGKPVPRQFLPMHIFLEFRTWVCSNSATGQLAPGADYVHWRHRVRFAGDPKRQMCEVGRPYSQDGC